jgi:hypothetical protein
MVLGLSLPTTTPGPTAVPLPTQTPIVIYTNTPTIEPPPTHTPSPTFTISPIAPTGTMTATLAVVCQGRTVGGNLLVNGDFEGGQHSQDMDEVRVPDGWTAFWRPGGTPVTYDKENPDGYQRPEMMVIPKQPPYTNPPRVADGSQAFMITGSQRAFDAGIYQTLAVTPGDVLCVTGVAHAWSNRFSDNPFGSTVTTEDDLRNANFQLGIDAQGGTDPFASGVRWGEVTHRYDDFGPLNAVQVTASAPSITVFVRGFMMWRFDHNEMFFDTISLVKITP